MIEYLNALATGLLLVIAVFSLRDLTKITNWITNLNDVLDFLGKLPQWIQFYRNLEINVHMLRENSQILQHRRNDLNDRVKSEELQTGRCRKREVGYWLNSAETKCTEVQRLLHGMERQTNRLPKFLCRAWFGNLVERKIQEVDALYSSGVFEEVLSPVREQVELVTTALVGDAAKKNIKRIRTLLRNPQVTKIGVYGIEGIGKTALMMHIHNQLLRRNHDALVIMIPINEGHKEYHLQSEIANQLGIVLHEEDALKRASILNKVLSRKNFVLILDGLRKYVSEDKIGIPLSVGKGTMIVTSCTQDVCRKTGCHNIIAMDPLPYEEAFELFKQKVEVELQPPLGNVAKKIVEQCQGLPLKIVNKAADLRGLDDMIFWEETLNEMLAV